MRVYNLKRFFNEGDLVLCPKCGQDLSKETEDPWIGHEGCGDGWTVKAIETVYCPECGTEVVLSTWLED